MEGAEDPKENSHCISTIVLRSSKEGRKEVLLLRIEYGGGGGGGGGLGCARAMAPHWWRGRMKSNQGESELVWVSGELS